MLHHNMVFSYCHMRKAVASGKADIAGVGRVLSGGGLINIKLHQRAVGQVVRMGDMAGGRVIAAFSLDVVKRPIGNFQ